MLGNDGLFSSLCEGLQHCCNLALQSKWNVRCMRNIENTYCEGLWNQRGKLVLPWLVESSNASCLHFKSARTEGAGA